MPRPVKLLVLDCHGVVLTNPFMDFLDALARATGQPPQQVRDRWRRRLRTPFWEGELSERDLWRALARSEEGLPWRELLESHYQLNLGAACLERWSRHAPLWMLSNHRGAWLIPRLERFGLRQYFLGVLASDELKAAKPAPAAFQQILRQVAVPADAVFIDDQPRNVEAAEALGLRGLLADDAHHWISVVEELLALR